MKMQKMAVAVIFGFVLGINVACAQGIPTFVFDENGYGTYQAVNESPVQLAWKWQADPTGRSAANVLVYTMPFPSPSPGDIIISEVEDLNTIGDVVTFYNDPNGAGYVIFYSLDAVAAGPDLGLGPTGPGSQAMGTAWADSTAPDFNNVLANLSANVQHLNEYLDPLDEAWFLYIDKQPVVYEFYSDIPEPSTFGLLALGALGLLWRKRS